MFKILLIITTIVNGSIVPGSFFISKEDGTLWSSIEECKQILESEDNTKAIKSLQDHLEALGFSDMKVVKNECIPEGKDV